MYTCVCIFSQHNPQNIWKWNFTFGLETDLLKGRRAMPVGLWKNGESWRHDGYRLEVREKKGTNSSLLITASAVQPMWSKEFGMQPSELQTNRIVRLDIDEGWWSGANTSQIHHKRIRQWRVVQCHNTSQKNKRLWREVVTRGSGDKGKWWLREVVTKGRGDEGKWWAREAVTMGSGD